MEKFCPKGPSSFIKASKTALYMPFVTHWLVLPKFSDVLLSENLTDYIELE